MKVISYDRATALNLRGYDFVIIASTPNDEPCTQAGADAELQKMECTALINQMRRKYGPEPATCEYFILKNTGHDFGTYYEAAILYSEAETEEAEAGAEYAYNCENVPDNWDEEAEKELTAAGHPRYNTIILQLQKRA